MHRRRVSRGSPLRRLAIIGVTALAALAFASAAAAHGPHHSPIKPAYDCYRDANFTDTEGDVVVTIDLDLGVNVVWKCTCELFGSRTHCWWKEIDRYVVREYALDRARALTGPNHGPLTRRYIRVSWSARHGSSGCFIHRGYRYALVARRVG